MTASGAAERSAVPPDEVLSALLATAKHPVKKRNLQGLHEVCKRRYDAKAANWSYQAVGRDAESVGVLTTKSLTLPTAKDYRTLIDAWKTAAQSFSASKRVSPKSDWIESIADPALRRLLEAKDVEIKELRSLLAVSQKHQQPVTVYLAAGPASADGPPAQPQAPNSRLLPSEVKALEKVMSPSYLTSLGWTEGTHGQVIDNDGVELFPAGFIPAIKKLLRAS